MKDYIDAKFTVVRPKRRWGFHIDWRNFLIVGGMILASGLARYFQML